MVTDNTSQTDDTTAFLRAARSGNLEKVIEYLDTNLDINTANSNGLNAMDLASKDGHVEIVTELLKRGAKVDAATKKGNTALHIASLAGQTEIVRILIQYGASVNIQSQNGFTPLYMAAQENHDQVVKLLLANGANQSLATEDGFTPLAVAMQQGHDKVVSVLLENDSKGKVRLPALHIAAKKDDCKAADLLLQNDHKPDVTSKSGFTPLHIAAHYGNEEIARLLIKRGADVNYLAKHNISPLHVAAKWGKNNMVKILLENSASIDAKTRDGLTPLHCAARSGHEEVVSTLLEHEAPISARTKNGLAPLHMASQGDHVDAARVLLYHRAPVDEVTIDYLTSLHVAAHCGHVRVAKLLLDRKADPNARALNGFTPLHIACKKNRIKVVELLLKHGASIESTTESGLTPLHVASFMGCMNIVIFLLQHEANPDVPTVRGETPLHLAARANQTDIIRILLRNGAKVDARAREEQTPLHIASRLGNVDIVMLLLQHGAAVDTTTKDMYTALHIAAKEGQEEVAAILVENHASVKATTKNGFTPLHIAAKYGNMNVAKILLQKDSKLDAQGKNNITPLHLACHYDHSNVANMILEKGASPHLASQNGHTPLHISARKNQMDIASTLLEHGADPNVQSKAGFTPLQLSAQKGHYDMTNLLIEHGADPNHKAKNGLTALHLCAQEDFIRVASVLVKNGANVESETETGYRPIHVAAHFGNLSMIRFLLKHNAQIDVRTNQNYTPLHQAAQQGHAHIVSALLEGNASHNARTTDGLTALNVAQKLGYISVMEVLKGLSYDTLTPDNRTWEEKYKVIAPESLQETSFMSDSDDEGVSDGLVNEQPYRYLTADLMKSLRDDSLPIDVTRDDPIHRQVSKEEKQEFVQSNNYCSAENFDTNDSAILAFLVSFLVDARGGAMKGCRHSGIRIIVPPRRATMPIRVTCRLMKPSKVANPPSLMEGEALATRIIEMGPVGASFLGPVLIDVPHFASVQGKEREIIILRSENGETWKEHDNSPDNDDTLFNTPHDPQLSASHNGRITRILTTEFPQYFAIVTRIKQEVHVIGADGGILISSVANHVQAVFPPGALTKKIKVGLQAHVIPTELTAKLLGNCVAVSPVITIEPRRRKFHKPITLTIPVPQAANKGMINQYGGETPTLRLLCSIAGGTSEAQWEDVTGSTPLTFMNDRVSFTTTVSARFWLMDCRNISEVPKMATELYKESLFVPYITNFVIYTKRMDVVEATLRILCMTDGREGIHTLERQEEFLEIVKSRDVEALDGKDLYIEFSGNLVPVTKSGVQLKFTFKAFRQNRLSFHVKVRDPLLDPVARMMFMRDPKVAKGELAQQPICVLNIVLPENMSHEENKNREYEDSNVTERKIDRYDSAYTKHEGEKGDRPKSSSPSESKFITDILQKEQTDAATIHESFAQKAASPLESVDASYPSNVSHQDELSPSNEKQTYTEKRKFWEDITRKRENYQRSESELSRTSQITANESDSECCIQNFVSEEETAEIVPERSETMEDLNIPDISECSVAEKAHYFEEQIQKELSTSRPTSKLITQESIKEQFAKLPSNLSGQSASDRADKMKRETEVDRKIEKEDWNLTESIKREKLVFVDVGKFEKTRTSLREDERNEAKRLDIDLPEDADQQEADEVFVDKIEDAEKEFKMKMASKETEVKTLAQEKSYQDSFTSAAPKESTIKKQGKSEFLAESLKLKDIAQPDLDAHRKICTEFLHHEAKLSHEELERCDREYKMVDKTIITVDERVDDESSRKQDNLESSQNFGTSTVPSHLENLSKAPKEDSPPSMIPRKMKPEVPSKFEAKKVPLDETETKQELPLEPQVSLARDKFLIEQDTKIYDKESTSPSEKVTLKLQEESKQMKKESRIPISTPKIEMEKEQALSKILISPAAKSILSEETPSLKLEKEKEEVSSEIPISPSTKSVPSEEKASSKLETEKEQGPSKIPISPAAKSILSEEIPSLKLEKEKDEVSSKIPISPSTKSVPSEEKASSKLETENEQVPSKIPISPSTKSVPSEEKVSSKLETENEQVPSKIPISPSTKSVPSEEKASSKLETENEQVPSKIPISPSTKSVPSEEKASPKLETEKKQGPSKIPISPTAKHVSREGITSPKRETKKEQEPSKIPISPPTKSVPSEEIALPKLEKEKEQVPSKIPISPSTKSISSEEPTAPNLGKEKNQVPSKIPISPSAKSVPSEEITSPKLEKEKEHFCSKIPISPSAKSVSSEEITSPKKCLEEKTSPKLREESKPVKKDSRIPISATKVEKEKESVPSKIPVPPADKSTSGRSPSSEESTSPKKEFESRIPKLTALTKGPEKEARKDPPTETLTEIKTTEKLSSQHYQKQTSETTTKTISKTFVAQSTDASRIFEQAETKIKQDTSVVTSEIDHKASTETKQVTSSDANKEPETFFKHEQSDHKLKEKLSESTTTKETPQEVLYDRQLELQKSDILGVEEISMTLKDGKQSVEAIAKKSNKVEKDEQRLQSLADNEGIFIQAKDSSVVKEREIDAQLKIERNSEPDEPLNLEDEMKRALINERRSEERTISEAHVVLPSDLGTKEFSSETKTAGKVESEGATVPQTPEERQERIVKELEARNIAETIIESIQTEIAKRSASLEGIKQLDTSDSDSKDYSENTLDMDTKESEVFHDQMADDLMKKFEDIIEKRSRSQSQVFDDNEMLPERLRSVILSHEENLEKISNRGSISVSEDLTKDEESTPYDKEGSFPSSSSQPKLIDRDMTMSPSSISDQIDLEVSLESEQSMDVESAKQGIERKSGLDTQDSVEPKLNDESGLDSVPSLEMDEPRVQLESSSGKVDQPKQIQEPIQVATIHESPAFDSLDEICQDRNVILSPSVVSENIKMDFPFDQSKPEKTKDMGKAKSLANLIVRRTESEESVSPSILSPRLRLKELEIKPVNWMIGDEKIEVSETLQPSQVFDKELEEYQRSLVRQQSQTSSRDGSGDDNEQESVTRSSEDVSTMDSVRETFVEKDLEVTTTLSSKFTVTAVPELDFESELVENRLDISCQELMDTLQREYEAKTPTEDRDETKYTYDSEKAEKETWKTPDFSTHVDHSLDTSAAKDKGIENVEVVSIEVPKLLLQDKTDFEAAEEPSREKPASIEKMDEKSEIRSEEKLKQPEIKLQQVSSETENKKETEVVVAARKQVDEVKSDVSLRGLKQTSPGRARKSYSDETKSSSHFEVREKGSSDKTKKEDLPAVDLSARYAITVLDQAVKKEIAEVKESLEAAKQDLIEELSENSETVFQIKDSPSEFQFKLEPETIPNDLPFLYKAPSFEQVEQRATGKPEGSPVAKPRRVDSADEKVAFVINEKVTSDETAKPSKTGEKIPEEKSQSSTDSSAKASKIKIVPTANRESKTIYRGTSGEASAEDSSISQLNPIAASRSSSDVENKEEGITLLAPQPAPRRRPKPARTSKKVTSESDAGSSSGDSSNYQSCDYEIGSGSRPSSSDIEALHSTLPSGTVSEYETALMSIEHSSTSRPTSQEYQSAVSTLSSRESMKSLNSLSSGHLGSIDSTGELSETLVASEAEDEQDGEKDHIDENLEGILDEDKEDKESDSSSSEIAMEDAFDKTSDDLPCRMKRSSEMIFQQIMDEAAADGEEPTNDEDLGPEEETRFDECTTEQLPSDTVAEDEEAFRTDSIFMSTDLTSEAYDKSFSSMESKTDVPEVLVEVTAGQGDASLLDTHVEAEEETDASETKQELPELTTSTDTEMPPGDTEIPADDAVPGTIGTLLHQVSTTSSTSGAMSFETVIEKDQKPDRHSPDSDSFELVDKPDIIDDFVVVEEVGREAEEFDSEGKSISIGSTSQSIKKYDRELENLIAAETKDDGEAAPTSQAIPRNNELFDFESEESPPMASNADDQYSQSLSDDENFEGSKKWMEMQFQADPRGYDLDYDRGRLEDIKEEEITDFEAGSSRFGSLGSHKGSIGSVGSMRGSYGSATEYDVLAGKKSFSKPVEHDNVSLSSLQEFESLESAVAMENSRKLQCGSQESVNNGSLPRRYVTSRSGHGDDISLSSLKDFEGLEKACREAHLIELRAREEEDLLDHESPENRYKLENLPRPKPVAEPVSATGSFNPSTSGSDDYEKRIMEIDEIIRIAQANVEKFDRQDDTTEDISQIEITADAEKMENIPSSIIHAIPDTEQDDLPTRPSDTNVMETSTDSLELEENVDKKHNPLCRSSDSLEMKTTIDFPSLSSDSLNNVRDPRESQIDTTNDRFSSSRRISSDSLEMPLVEQQPDIDSHDKSSESHGSYHLKESFDDSVEQTCSTTDTKITNNGKTRSPSMSES